MNVPEIRAQKELYLALAFIDCAVRLKTSAVADVMTWFQTEYIADPLYRSICQRILAMSDAGDPITSHVLAEGLQGIPEHKTYHQTLEQLGDMIYQASQQGAHLPYYAAAVYQEYRRSGASAEASSISREISDSEIPDPAIEKLGELPSKYAPPPDKRVSSNMEIFHELAADLEGKGERKSPRIFGLKVIDDVVELSPNALVTVAAETGCGKTVFLLQTALHMIARYQKAAMYISVEMTALEILKRAMCWLSRTPFNSSNKRPHIEAMATLQSWMDKDNLLQLFCGPLTAQRIEREVGSYLDRCEVGVICVDYLQLIDPSNPRDNREQQVALVSRTLKRLASRYGVPVIAASQVNKTGVHLSSLRESSAIGQDSDVVILLEQDDAHEAYTNMSIGIAKNRGGPTRFGLKAHWEKPIYRIRDIERDDPPAARSSDPAPTPSNDFGAYNLPTGEF